MSLVQSLLPPTPSISVAQLGNELFHTRHWWDIRRWWVVGFVGIPLFLFTPLVSAGLSTKLSYCLHCSKKAERVNPWLSRTLSSVNGNQREGRLTFPLGGSVVANVSAPFSLEGVDGANVWTEFLPHTSTTRQRESVPTFARVVSLGTREQLNIHTHSAFILYISQWTTC